jgi:hypothetical protein
MVSKLVYDSQDFPVGSRKAIANGEPFSFEVRGKAWESLQPHVIANDVPKWAGLATIPELRSLVGVFALASVHEMPVRVLPNDNFAEIFVGSTH